MLTLTIMSPGQVLEASGNIPSPSTRCFHLCHFPMSKPHGPRFKILVFRLCVQLLSFGVCVTATLAQNMASLS